MKLNRWTSQFFVFAILVLFSSCAIVVTAPKRVNNPSSEHFGKGMVTIAFDDGFKSAYDVALPILQSEKIHANFFLITDAPRKADHLYMNETEIRKIASEGHEIGSHSQTHPYLTRISEDKMKEEVSGSKKDLALLYIRACTFAYPYDDYNDAIRNAVIRAGYVGARTSDSGFNFRDSDRFLLKTQNVLVTTTPEQIRAWIDNAVANRTWVILLFHSIDRTGSPYSVTPETLQTTINYLRSNKVKTVTVVEGIQYMH